MEDNAETRVLNYFWVSLFLRVPNMDSTEFYRIYGEISGGLQTREKIRSLFSLTSKEKFSISFSYECRKQSQ